MDAKALVAALAGTAIGAAVCYRLAKREWWAVSSVLAIGAAGLLGIVTEGNNSHVEHSVVFYVSVSLILWFTIAFFVHQAGVRRRSRSRD
jgi:hypothetical protein